MRKKVIVVKQTSIKDCGAACLLSVIKYYNGFVPLETIKIDTNTSNAGTNFYELIKSANRYGFDAVGYQLSPEKIYDDKRIFPAICQVIIRNMTHFIVIYSIDKKNAIIMDPAFGKKTIDYNDFFEIWTGAILELTPRNSILFIKNSNNLFDLIMNIIVKEKKLITKLLFTSLMFIIITIISAYYFQITMSNLNADVDIFKFILLFFILIFLFKGILVYIRKYYEMHLNKNIDVSLLKEFFYHLFNLPLKVVDTKNDGEIITRANDLNSIKYLITQIILSLSLDVILMIIAIPLLIIIDGILFMIVFIIIIIYALITIIFNKIISKKIIKNKDLEVCFNTCILDNVRLFKNVKRLNKTTKVLLEIENESSKYLYDTFKIEKSNTLYLGIKNIVNELLYVMVNTIGFYNVYKNNMTITNLITFNMLMNFFIDPIKNLISNILKYNFIKASYHRLNEFMDIKEESLGSIQMIEKYDISLENVTFGYNDLYKVLKKINIVIKEKEHVLLKGKSGSGKSTICKLLLKEELNYEGNININNIDLKNINLNTIRNFITYISQKEYLYSKTIYDNISFHNDIETEKFDKICKLCMVDSILKNKSLSYESLLENDTNNFSGGEKQRIILARACLNDFSILIIDEALSEVDLETEIKIIKNLKKHFKNKTIIYITHKNVDKEFKKVIDFA